MSVNHGGAIRPIALQPGEGEALWFMGMLATVKASMEGTDGVVAVIEHTGPQHSGSPLHLHHNEDEWFYVLEGELTIWVDGESITAPAGAFAFAPKNLPHTFIVSSTEGARFLLVTEPAGFESFMRLGAEPAKALALPPPPIAPPDAERLTALAAEYGIDILGPPGIPT